jgi:hypothetical protein
MSDFSSTLSSFPSVSIAIDSLSHVRRGEPTHFSGSGLDPPMRHLVTAVRDGQAYLPRLLAGLRDFRFRGISLQREQEANRML